MKTKDQVQVEAGIAIEQNNGRGLIAMATGTGKSKVAIDRAEKLQKNNFDLRVLIVVPTEKLRDVNWRDEFYKWNQGFLWENNVERSCYVSISKLEGEVYDLVILDEAHNITENNSRFFEQNTVHECIALTATPPTEQIKVNLLLSQRLKTIYTVTLDEAVAWGLVSPYKITVVYTTLNNVNRTIKSGNKDKVFYVTEQASYNWLTKQINAIDFSEATPQQLGKRKTLVLKRMRLIYDLPSKTEAAQFLLKHYIPKDQRTLIFAGSIKQAEKLCEHSFHSESKNDINYVRFKNEELNVISSVRSLNQGENIPNLDNGFIVQINSKERDAVQRVGRVVRYRDGHLGNIVILCAKNTQDEVWMRNALEGFDSDRIEYVNLSELKMQYL